MRVFASRISHATTWRGPDFAAPRAGLPYSATYRSPMKTILAIILIVAGVGVFFQGLNRRDTIAGRADAVGSSIANNVDGGARQPKHVVMMVVGGAMVVLGIGMAMRRTPPAITR
jgi:hypothetical protein